MRAKDNVGRGEGSSVLEGLETVRQVTGRLFAMTCRPGPPGTRRVSSARFEAFAAELGWTSQQDLRQLAASAWAAYAPGSRD